MTIPANLNEKSSEYKHAVENNIVLNPKLD